MKTRSLLILAMWLVMLSMGVTSAQDDAQDWPIELTVGEATFDLSAEEIGDLFRALLEKAGN